MCTNDFFIRVHSCPFVSFVAVCFPLRAGDVGGDGDEVAGAAGEDEAVPDGVVEGEAVPEVEDDAGGVGDAAGEDPGDGAAGELAEHGAGGEQAAPAHGDVDEGGDDVVAVSENEFEDRTGGGESPEDAEEAPSPGAADEDEEERRVTAGDQGVDRDVVEEL